MPLESFFPLAWRFPGFLSTTSLEHEGDCLSGSRSMLLPRHSWEYGAVTRISGKYRGLLPFQVVLLPEPLEYDAELTPSV